MSHSSRHTHSSLTNLPLATTTGRSTAGRRRRHSVATRAIAIATAALLPLSLGSCGLGSDRGGSISTSEQKNPSHDKNGRDAQSTVDNSPVVLIFDASSSMLANDAGGSRLAAAKRASHELINGIGPDTPLSLITFGDTVPQRVGDESETGLRKACADVTTRLPLKSGNDEKADALIDGIEALGYTPLAASLEQAEKQLPSKDEKATVILLSDGEDTCGDHNPVDVAASIRRAHPGVTINTVGFKTSNQQLRDIAEAGGGTFLTADNINQLTGRLEAARSAKGARSRLSDTGVYGITISSLYHQIADRYSDFPSFESATETEDHLFRIRWRDCYWIFTMDQMLAGIQLTDDVETIDGLRKGSSISDATKLFGDPVYRSQLDSNKWEVFYPASDGLHWHITYTSSGNGHSGTIVTITLCSCNPPQSTGDHAQTNSAAKKEAKTGSTISGPFDSQGRWVITYDAIGPYPLGSDSSQLASDGASESPMMAISGSKACSYWDMSGPNGAKTSIVAKNGKVFTGPAAMQGMPSDGEWVTDRGITIGDTAAKLRAAYPDLQNTDDANWASGPTSYSVWSTNSEGHTMVFLLEAPSGGSGGPLPDNATVTQMFVTEASGSFGGEAAIQRGC